MSKMPKSFKATTSLHVETYPGQFAPAELDYLVLVGDHIGEWDSQQSLRCQIQDRPNMPRVKKEALLQEILCIVRVKNAIAVAQGKLR